MAGLIGADGAVGSEFATCVRSNTWPVAEHFGLVFLHLGTPASGPAPVPDDAAAFRWATGKPVELQTHWHNFMVNSFDLQHLQAVHHRQVIDLPPRIERDERSVTWNYVSRVTGGSPSDRLMKWLSGDRIRVKMRCFGTIITVSSGSALHEDDRDPRGVAVEGRRQGVRHVRGANPGPFLRGRLWLARTLYTAFLRRDLRIIEGMQLRSGNASDPCVRALLGFLQGLAEHGV